MTKSELINRVAERLPYLTRKDAEIIVNTIFDSMVDALVDGDRIEIRGFGSIFVKEYGAYKGRNPKTGEAVALAGKYVPHFKPGKDLRDRVNANRHTEIKS